MSLGSRQNHCLESDMRALFNDPSFSDFKIVCGDQTFDCHKCIVANKSDVLKTMLLSENWTENKKDTLKIEDFNPDIVKMVNFSIVLNVIC
jgi:hypothetical protein